MGVTATFTRAAGHQQCALTQQSDHPGAPSTLTHMQRSWESSYTAAWMHSTAWMAPPTTGGIPASPGGIASSPPSPPTPPALPLLHCLGLKLRAALDATKRSSSANSLFVHTTSSSHI